MCKMNNLLYLINKTKISVRKLSTYVGINNSTLSQVVNGKRKMSSLYIEKLSRFFCVTSDFLLGLSDKGIFVYYSNGFETIDMEQYNMYSNTGMIETVIVNDVVYRVANKELSKIFLKDIINESNNAIKGSNYEELLTMINQLNDDDIDKVIKFIKTFCDIK